MAAVTLASPLVCDEMGECLADICLGRGDICAKDGPTWIAGSTCVDAVCLCTPTDGGLSPAVPWSVASDGTVLTICLDEDATAAASHQMGRYGEPTITINTGEMRLVCGKPRGGGAAADADLCRVLDRLDVSGPATVLVMMRLLFEGFDTGGGYGVVYLTYGAVTVSECSFRGNHAGVRRAPLPPPATPVPHAARGGGRARGWPIPSPRPETPAR
jgi:hypothetical protein